MSSLLRGNPVWEFEEFGQRIAPWSGRPGREGGARRRPCLTGPPSVDVAEEGNAYVVSAELPEVKKEDTKVSTENGFLTVPGERRKEREEKKGVRYHRTERCDGSFLGVLPSPTTPIRPE